MVGVLPPPTIFFLLVLVVVPSLLLLLLLLLNFVFELLLFAKLKKVSNRLVKDGSKTLMSPSNMSCISSWNVHILCFLLPPTAPTAPASSAFLCPIRNASMTRRNVATSGTRRWNISIHSCDGLPWSSFCSIGDMKRWTFISERMSA